MRPRLEAEERLAAYDIGRMGVGRLRRYDEHQAHQRLQRASRGGQRRRAARADPAALARMGIAVVGLPEISQKAVNDG